MKVYRVDIDCTICDTPNVDSVNRYDLSTPYHWRIKVINRLYDEGNTIIYWTARGASTGIDWHDYTKKQLDSWGCKYHELKTDKPAYDVLICDKAHNTLFWFEDTYKEQHGDY